MKWSHLSTCLRMLHAYTFNWTHHGKTWGKQALARHTSCPLSSKAASNAWSQYQMVIRWFMCGSSWLWFMYPRYALGELHNLSGPWIDHFYIQRQRRRNLPDLNVTSMYPQYWCISNSDTISHVFSHDQSLVITTLGYSAWDLLDFSVCDASGWGKLITPVKVMTWIVYIIDIVWLHFTHAPPSFESEWLTGAMEQMPMYQK